MVGLVRRLMAGAALVSLGCAATSEAEEAPDPSDRALPPGDTLLVDLSDEEALRLCEWQSEHLHEGHCLQNAIISGRAFGDCAGQFARCMAADAVASLVLDCVERTLDPTRTCDDRVTDVTRCAIDTEAFFVTLPNCDQVTDESFRRVLYSMSPASCETLGC